MKNDKLSYALALAVICSLLWAGCEDRPAQESRAEIAVTNSYLGCVVRDLCGDDEEVLCLAPPGMCPGHFDISPSQVRQLRDCRMLLLFDFQERIEGTLSRFKEKGLKTASVAKDGGLCVPETYLAACREVNDILSSEYPESKSARQQRPEIIENRLQDLREELLGKVQQAGLSSAEVLTSNHQADFARWLGLEPVATFVGSDIETAAGIDHCIKKAKGRDVRFVIANKQEGMAIAQAMAERLGAKAVVFSNFPEVTSGTSGFDELLRANVQTLLEAARQ